MGLLDRLKTLWPGETQQEQPTYRYQCTVCQATFETPEPNADAVGCEQCGAHKVRSLSPD
jgi:putative FmdB family regulatory protein